MKIAICDDEKMFVEKIRQLLRQTVEKYGDECKFLTCDRGSKLIEICQKERVNAVFLDISMPELDGFKTAEKLLEIHENIILVFVSSKEEMVFSSYEYRPFWFVPKSQMQMLEVVMNKVIQKYEKDKNKLEVLPIYMENKIIEIDLKNTAYLKTSDHYIRIAERDKNESTSYRCKMNEVEQQLGKEWFVRVHNRYLVNCRCIRTIEKSKCVLLNNEEIPISRSRMSQVKENFQDYLRSIR